MRDTEKFQSVNLSDIAKAVARNPKVQNLSLKDVKDAIQITIDRMSYALTQGQRIEIRKFGSFSLHRRKPSMTRNLKTSKAVFIPTRVAPHFKPSSQLREKVNASVAASPAAPTDSHNEGF